VIPLIVPEISRLLAGCLVWSAPVWPAHGGLARASG